MLSGGTVDSHRKLAASRAHGSQSSSRPGGAIAPSVRLATRADAAALAALINDAYRVEAFFVDGDRTTADEVAALAASGHFLVLERGDTPERGDRSDRRLAAAALVRIDGARGKLGMLSVAPDLQGLGLGTRLVAVAEALCTALGCAEVELQMVNLRDDLATWYRRQGYREVGTLPYEHRPVKRPCHFVRLQKSIA